MLVSHGCWVENDVDDNSGLNDSDGWHDERAYPSLNCIGSKASKCHFPVSST